MPGGYGTSGPWGSAGTSYVSPGQSSSPYRPGGGSTNQGGSNAVADYYNQVQYEKSPEYLNNPEDFSNPYEQAAASYQAAGAVTSGALGGTALWTQAPRLPDGSIDYAKQNLIDKYDNVYYSSFAPGTDAYSPTGLIATSKDPVTGEVKHHVVGGSSSYQSSGPGGPGGPSYRYGSDYGGRGGSYSGIGGYAPAHRRHQAFLDQLYKGRLAGGKEVHKMLASNQKVEGANIISGLSQDAKAFDMDPKRRGILAVLQA